jgi:cytidine deaminase
LDDKDLVDRAMEAAGRAYAPHSGLRVGASVLTTDGEVFTGCNVENASYGLTVCAERVAIFAAVAAGHRHIVAVAIASMDIASPMPCGACLQVMEEFGVKRVIVGRPDGELEGYEFRHLLPRPFSL